MGQLIVPKNLSGHRDIIIKTETNPGKSGRMDILYIPLLTTPP